MTILDELASYAKERTRINKEKVSLQALRDDAEKMSSSGFVFEKALEKEGVSFICECKKASPSKGIIAEDFPYLLIAKEYEAAGADCISVLTEPKWFLGSDDYLRKISSEVSIPCLRKDFTVDEYMIYEAKTLGASAVLLICSILSPQQLKEYIEVSDSLGLTAIAETHNENEVYEAIAAKARVIGVNNRNLKDFSVDTNNSANLRKLVPSNVLFIAESGIKTPEDVESLRKIGVDAVLVGETLMRAPDKKAMLQSLRGNL